MHRVQGAVLSTFLETVFSSSFSQFWQKSLWLAPSAGHCSSVAHRYLTYPPNHIFSANLVLSLPSLHVPRHMDLPQQKLFLLETASTPSCSALLPLTSHSPLWLGRKESSFSKKGLNSCFFAWGFPQLAQKQSCSAGHHRISS